MPSGELVGTTLKFTGQEVMDGHSHFPTVWANLARNEGMGLNHARVSEVRHVEINEDRFATCIGGITKDNQSNSKCLGYDCGHDDILQVTGLVYSKNVSNLVGGIANKGL